MGYHDAAERKNLLGDEDVPDIDVVSNDHASHPLVRVGPKQTVFNPFPRRHLEPSPSECGRQGGPSHTT